MAAAPGAPSNSLFSLLECVTQPHHHSTPSSSSVAAAAARPSLSLSLPSSSFIPSYPFLSLHRPSHRYRSPSSSPPCPPHPSNSLSSLTILPRTAGGVFLGPGDLDKLRILEDFRYVHKLDRGGSVEVRVMRLAELDAVVGLLAESFAEAMWMPERYSRFLDYPVRQYVMQKMGVLPHAATLVVFYRAAGGGEGEGEFVGTAEVSFDAVGANASPPTPLPPRGSPYICNMAVKLAFRRRGIGRQLLKACEELISKMSDSEEVYLHCRMIDKQPLTMYKNADYRVVKTDSILICLTLQRRKHLMCKKKRFAANKLVSNHPSK